VKPVNTIVPFNNMQHRRAVIDVWTQVFAYSAAHNAPESVIDQKLAVDDGLFWVALRQDQLMGTVMAGYDGHRGWLYALAVLPDFTHQGWGKALVQQAEKALADRGCVKVNLQIIANNHAVTAFYETLGYSVEPRVSMGKILSDPLPQS
jgi:ribosomal protein S18 acetylase RimI-like enzyme